MGTWRTTKAVVLLRMLDKHVRKAKDLVDSFPYPKKLLSESLMDEVRIRNKWRKHSIPVGRV